MAPVNERGRDAAWLIRNLRPERSHPVGDAGLGALAYAIERQDLPEGQLLYKRGTTPRGIWALRSGSVQLSCRLRTTRSLVQMVRPGDIVGDVPILLNRRSLTTAHIREPATLLFVAGHTLRSILSTHADLCFLWMQNVAIRLEGARRRILQLLGEELTQSLARLILDEHVDGRLHLSQAALAQMLGVQRTSVNRALQVLRRRGVVELSYGGLSIKDRGGLEDLALLTERSPDAQAPDLELDAGTLQALSDA
ncbi:MAG: Crp/Fnr family transcriptional regulator [Actinomycetota bacterium]